MLHLPRVMFAAPSSGSGKTMITCGILQALSERGLNPASFKCGPDYIDPMFHSRVIGAPSRNLDTFFTDEPTTRYLFAKTAKHAGISVLEGVMGIYDGLGGISVKASSYDLARVTDTPIILIVNARGMSLSVIPLIQGYLNYQMQTGQVPRSSQELSSAKRGLRGQGQTGQIRGVILNQTTKMTYLLLKEEIEKQTGVRLYGYVPRLDDAAVESRHLGLVTPGEIADLKERLSRLAAELEQCLDMEGILALAQEAEDYENEILRLPPGMQRMRERNSPVQSSGGKPLHGDASIMQSMDSNDFHTAVDVSRPEALRIADDSAQKNPEALRVADDSAQKRKSMDAVKIAVAQDEAFCFYYQDNLDLLKMLGAELVPFSPLHDAQLPERIGGLILGGGYPELYARQLSGNVSMRISIRQAIEAGLPYLAECGGFMYLHETMEDMDGGEWPMCGCISGKSYRTQKLGRFGYIELGVNLNIQNVNRAEHRQTSAVNLSERAAPTRLQPADVQATELQTTELQTSRSHTSELQTSELQTTDFLLPGETIRAHEFHYFDSTDPGESYTARKPVGSRSWNCIHADDHSVAGYPHLYYWSNPKFAERFLERAAQFSL